MAEENVRRTTKLISGEALLAADHLALNELANELRVVLDEGEVCTACDLLDLLWARLAVHIRAENLRLFPAILRAPASMFTGQDGLPQIEEARNIIARLREDHDVLMRELAKAVQSM